MNEKGIFLKNIYALMTGSDRPALSGVDMRIDSGKVNRIGVGLAVPEEYRIIDCSNLVVVPGFVNTHHHFFQTLTRNLPAVQEAENVRPDFFSGRVRRKDVTGRGELS